MEARNQSFENSLRCLQHPATLLSIALLLLNDHVFKIISPSWLTGKLSDFAGLFFFPFIIAAGLSMIFGKLKAPDIGVSAFSLVGIWFALLKTVPFVNQVSAEGMSEMLGWTVRLVLDPTDTLALLVLYPAWQLWKVKPPNKNVRVTYTPLLLGLLASIATSPPAPEVEVVTHLLVNDSHTLAVDIWNGTAAISRDGGKTWEWDWNTEFDSLPEGPRQLPIEICTTQIRAQCFRINGEGIVEESMNGGETWEISWQQPPARLSYLNRIDPDIDVGPYDLTLVFYEDHEYILAAMGEEGILRRELPDGNWERIPVQNAEPTPYGAENISSIFTTVWREVLIWFLLSLLAFATACLMVWNVNLEGSQEKLDIGKWIIWPSLSPLAGLIGTISVQLMIAILGLGVGQIAVSILSFDLLPIWLMVVACALLAALAIWPMTVNRELTRWKKVLTDQSYSSQISNEIATASHQSHLWTFLAGLTVWVAWSFGVIPRYEFAMALAIFCSGAIAIIFIRRVQKLSRKNEL